MINDITEDATQSSVEKCVWIITALEREQFASTLTSMIGKASKFDKSKTVADNLCVI